MHCMLPFGYFKWIFNLEEKMTEDKIKEAAKRAYLHKFQEKYWDLNIETEMKQRAFVAGATSQIAREYWASKQGEWISVEDRLPDNFKSVLAATNKGMLRITWIDRGTRLFDVMELNEYQQEQYTHWMPLPQPPKFPQETK